VVGPTSVEPVIEHLAREISVMVSTAQEQIRQAASASASSAVTKVSAHLDARTRAIDSNLAEAARQSAELVQKIDELLRTSVQVAEHNDSLLAEAQKATATKLEEVIKRTENQVGELLKRGEAQSKNLGLTAQALVNEATRNGRRLTWKPWSMATAFAVTTVLMTTLLRPGWTMDAEQRQALRVGEAVIYTYSVALESERAEMRRVMNWRKPANPDSLAVPPIPPKP
jgi:F0F1-type ATP synthase membrane subunit b/b'